jgi:hypothetical protein
LDYFEQIVAQYLESKGFWVRSGVRVLLSKADKRELGKPSLPRPEIDLIAFNLKANELIAFEVKSYLDSPGVKYESLATTTSGEGRLKILTDPRYQALLAERLKEQCIESKLILPSAKLRFGLAAGNVPRLDREKIKALAEQRGWMYVAPEDISQWVRSLAELAYENDPVVLAAKLILREGGHQKG